MPWKKRRIDFDGQVAVCDILFMMVGSTVRQAGIPILALPITISGT